LRAFLNSPCPTATVTLRSALFKMLASRVRLFMGLDAVTSGLLLQGCSLCPGILNLGKRPDKP
jgi:hypothetical protein